MKLATHSIESPAGSIERIGVKDDEASGTIRTAETVEQEIEGIRTLGQGSDDR